MARISDKNLKPRDEKILIEKFSSFLVNLGKTKTQSFTSEFFTHTEQILYAKRLLIILLLEKKVPTIPITKILYVSPTTVDVMRTKYANGNYQNILHSLKKADRDDMWKMVEMLSRGGLPEMGKRRWEWLDAHFNN